MNSEIKVESSLGVGSTFSFILNLPTSEAEKIHPSTTLIPMIRGYKGSKRKILLINDYQDNCTLIRQFLEPLKFKVDEAHIGEEGFKKALDLQPDLVLIDLIVPNINGWKIVRQLRQTPQGKNMVIIVFSANVSEDYQQQSYEVGCDDFLAKPIQAQQLFEQLQKHL